MLKIHLNNILISIKVVLYFAVNLSQVTVDGTMQCEMRDLSFFHGEYIFLIDN